MHGKQPTAVLTTDLDNSWYLIAKLPSKSFKTVGRYLVAAGVLNISGEVVNTHLLF
jgi:hypothetical protein